VRLLAHEILRRNEADVLAEMEALRACQRGHPGGGSGRAPRAPAAVGITR
jgi:hypothetical protein